MFESIRFLKALNQVDLFLEANGLWEVTTWGRRRLMGRAKLVRHHTTIAIG
jgi:hypothetical protein